MSDGSMSPDEDTFFRECELSEPDYEKEPTFIHRLETEHSPECFTARPLRASPEVPQAKRQFVVAAQPLV